MPTYRRYLPSTPAVRDLRRQGGNDDARARVERAGDVTIRETTPPPTKEPEPTPASVSPEASPAAEGELPKKRGRGRPRKADADE
jgi:hypothetical protein